MQTKYYLKWEEIDITWDQLDMLWEDISILIEVGKVIKRGGGGLAAYIQGNPWAQNRKELGEEKAKKFIKIFCSVNGLDYEETVKLKDDIKVTVEQMEKVFNEARKIGVKVDF